MLLRERAAARGMAAATALGRLANGTGLRLTKLTRANDEDAACNCARDEKKGALLAPLSGESTVSTAAYGMY